MIDMEAGERKRSRGGFLNLFDWSGKSKKKLFSSKTSELSGASSKQEKQNAQNPSKPWPSPIEGDENGKSLTYNPRNDSSCSTSTVTSDDGLQQGCKAPSVVARLMGLESLPVLNSLEPRSNPDYDPFFLTSSRKASTWDAYENPGYVNLRSDYDSVSWDHLDSRTNARERSRPIDRFQTETLPPRSAKPISVTHNRLLSPIRSPGFVQSRNPAYVMEAASRMIEPSPRITAAKARFTSSDSSSSSLPMRIRDLRAKLEASSSPQLANGSRNNKFLRGKHDEKRTTSSLKTHEKNKVLGKSSFNGLKGKAKPPSVSAHAKVNTIHKQDSSTSSSGNRGSKEKMEAKNGFTRNGLKESSTITGKTVVKPNNQKQNQFAVTSVSNQKGSKVTNKVVNKVLVETGTTSKKTGFTATSAEKNTTLSLSSKKNLPRNKKPPNGVQERIKRCEKSIKCNITIDGGVKTGEEDNRKKDMDVISFTFSSPIKGLSSSDSRSSVKKTDQDTESALSFNVMNGDSLNILLEQKLRELTSKLESSCNSLTQEEDSSSSFSKDWVNGAISLPSDDLDKVLSENESVSDCTSFYNNRKFQDEEQEVNSFGIVTERNESCHEIKETEISDSVALFSEEGHDWELEYITEIIASGQMMVKEFSLGMATDILPLSLFDEIEGNKRDARGKKIERKMLFDFVNQCLSSKCEKMFMGNCRGLLGKEGILFDERREILAEEVKKEIEGLKKMREMMMTDELVDNDMSSFEGKWLDYKRETYEEGIEIEDEIVSDLVDDLVNDLLLCF